jgi:hypothetical protein
MQKKEISYNVYILRNHSSIEISNYPERIVSICRYRHKILPSISSYPIFVCDRVDLYNEIEKNPITFCRIDVLSK